MTIHLSVNDRQYIVTGEIEMCTKSYGVAATAPERAKALDALYEVVEDHIDLGLGNKGRTVYLGVFKRKGEEQLYGFRYTFFHQEIDWGCEYGDNNVNAVSPIFPVDEKVITRSVYIDSSGDQLDAGDV